MLKKTIVNLSQKYFQSPILTKSSRFTSRRHLSFGSSTLSNNSHATKDAVIIGTSIIIGIAALYQQENQNVTHMEYWDHDPNDFDIYIAKSEMTKDHLPYLLHKFDNEGLDVWPWIWTHPNDDGPHHVFLGVSDRILDQIEKLRKEEHQEKNNILIIASQHALDKVAIERNDKDIYSRCQCGLVTDTHLELLNEEKKILMLADERIISFDYLTLS